MASIYTPDLSGVDPQYYVSTFMRTIFRDSQVIKFTIPVFVNDKLEVLDVSGDPVNLERGVEYRILDDNIDYDAMSRMKLIDNNFDGILIKSLVIEKPFTEDYNVQLKFNQLHPNDLNVSDIDDPDAEIEVTGTMLVNLFKETQYLAQVVANHTFDYTSTPAIVRSLNIDLSGVNESNLIVEEEHDIDTINGINCILPSYGDFYKQGLIITKANGEVITDLTFQDLDLGKTSNSSGGGGVYRSVKYNGSYVGIVKVTYQAYGDSISPDDFKTVLSKISIMERFLTDNPFLTSSGLKGEPTISNLTNRLVSAEGTMRNLILGSTPNYVDQINNESYVKKCTAVDNESHWWSIAKLYRVSGNDSNIVADVFKFRLKTLNSKMMFEVAVSVNKGTSYTGDIFEITCLNSNLPKNTLYQVKPKLRLIETTQDGYSGLVLQLGMKLQSLQETVSIESFSGRESCWLFSKTFSTAVDPEDTDITMPSGSVYTTDGIGVKSIEKHIPFKKICMTNTIFNLPLTTGEVADDENVFQLDDFSGVTSITLKGSTNIGTDDKPFEIKVPVTCIEEDEISFRLNKVLEITDLEVTINKSSDYTLTINSTLGDDTYNVTEVYLNY